MRTLLVDDKKIGIVVFSQRCLEQWSNWGFSNRIIVKLEKGKHTFSLDFLSNNENINGKVNQAMLDYLRIIKK